MSCIWVVTRLSQAMIPGRMYSQIKKTLKKDCIYDCGCYLEIQHCFQTNQKPLGKQPVSYDI